MGSVPRMPGPSLTESVARVSRSLTGVGRLGVAFSGGVDSTLLVALASRALGPHRVVAVLAVSASLAADERRAARDVARELGVELVEVVTHELDDPSYRANDVDRCYFCKHELFTRIDESVQAQHRLDAVAYGENADDVVRADRPGARAATEHGVLRPLADAGLTKDDVRRLARELDLTPADKPAAPCLASRIPHHTPVTALALRQVEQAEAALRALGLTELRVRHHGALARVELGPQDLARVDGSGLRERVESAVLAAGFEEVSLDPRGLQSGAFTLVALTTRPDA